MLRANIDTSDTIFALASGTLPSAVAIVRLSGAAAFEIASRVAGRPLAFERGMSLATLFESDGKPFDEALVLTFVGPHSFTGEDVVEFQTHGSVPVVRLLSEQLVRAGARPARAGEFAYRGFLSGKLDTSALEHLGDLFLAKQAEDVRAIWARKEISIEASLANLRTRVLTIQAILDTSVDFSEEYSAVANRALEPIQESIQECAAVRGRYAAFLETAPVPRLVLAGRPNAGKSSLFNALLCRYRSIVCDEAGTTRDVVEEDVELDGRHWKLVDTAGFRDVASGPERAGIEMGQEALGSATFWILVVDGMESRDLSPERALLEKFGKVPHVVVWNKKDRPEWYSRAGELSEQISVEVSAATGDRVAELWDILRNKAHELSPTSSLPLPSRSQAERFGRVEHSLRDLAEHLIQGTLPEILAEKNRQILAYLEPSIGTVDIEDVLDRVFGEFCIGK